MSELQRRKAIHLTVMACITGSLTGLMVAFIQYHGLVNILAYTIGGFVGLSAPFAGLYVLRAIYANYEKMKQLEESEELSSE